MIQRATFLFATLLAASLLSSSALQGATVTETLDLTANFGGSNPQTKQDLIENFSNWPGITITNGNYIVEFDSLGSPTVGGGGGVQITNGTNIKIISVSTGTGRVTIQ